MGGGAYPPFHPMTRGWPTTGFGKDERVTKQRGRAESSQAVSLAATPELEAPMRSRVGPFFVGTVIGGIAGTIVGTALSPYTRGLVVGLYHLISRRLSSSERDQLRFELLLQ